MLRQRSNMWHYRFQLNGKTYEGTTHLRATGANKIAAEQIEDAKRREAATAGKFGAIKPVRLGDAWRAFLKVYAGEVKPSSLRRIAVSGTSILDYLGPNTEVNAIAPGDIEDFKAWRRDTKLVKEVTIRHDIHALAPFLSYCRKKRWLDHDPLEDVKIPSDKDAIRNNVLTPDMQRRYLTQAMRFPLLYDFARVLLNQGLRPEEARLLKKEDIDLERGTLRVRESKTPSGRRTLTMTIETREIVTRRMAGASEWVFASPRGNGKDVPVGRLNNSHDRACALSGVQCTLYDFRHTFATRFAETADIPTLCAVLGHSNTRMVMRYVHPRDEHVREAMKTFDQGQRKGQGREKVN